MTAKPKISGDGRTITERVPVTERKRGGKKRSCWRQAARTMAQFSCAAGQTTR
jgi:hypothetical protein